MKLCRLLGPLLLVLLPLTGCAEHRDFDSVVSAVEQRYGTQPQRVPMMGFVSLCAWVTTGGGVRDMKIANFEHLAPSTEASALESLVAGSLGGDWQRFVTERHRNGELHLIFVHPDGHGMRMFIANFESGELNVVRMEINGERLSRWITDPHGESHRRDYASNGGGAPD